MMSAFGGNLLVIVTRCGVCERGRGSGNAAVRRRRHAWFMIPIGYGRAETLLPIPAAEPIPQQALLWGGFWCRSEGATQGSLHLVVDLDRVLARSSRVLVDLGLALACPSESMPRALTLSLIHI